jgi:hypothetical protein
MMKLKDRSTKVSFFQWKLVNPYAWHTVFMKQGALSITRIVGFIGVSSLSVYHVSLRTWERSFHLLSNAIQNDKKTTQQNWLVAKHDDKLVTIIFNIFLTNFIAWNSWFTRHIMYSIYFFFQFKLKHQTTITNLSKTIS